MNIYLIISGPELQPSEENINRLKLLGQVKLIFHKGDIAEIEDLKNDPNEKILGLDPDINDWKLDAKKLIENVKNIKAVFTNSTSYDWLEPKILKGSNITVANVPGFSYESVAEYAICLAMESAKRLPMHLKNDWNVDWSTPPMLLRGKKLGIIGLGRIGKKIAEIGQGIGMNVIYWSQKTRDERFQYSELKDLYKTADIIIPALIENAETKQYTTNDHLNLMQKHAILVGLNRIKVLWDEEYVMKRVEENKLGGYAFEGENAKIYTTYKGNIWGVPAIAWFTEQSLHNLEKIWFENIVKYLEDTPQNIV